jgi:hypothetical protein
MATVAVTINGRPPQAVLRSVIRDYCSKLARYVENADGGLLISLDITDDFITPFVATYIEDYLTIGYTTPFPSTATAAFDVKVNDALTMNDSRELWNAAALADRLGCEALHAYVVLIIASAEARSPGRFTLRFSSTEFAAAAANQHQTRIRVEYSTPPSTSRTPSATRNAVPLSESCAACGRTALGACATCQGVAVCSATCLARVHADCFAVKIVPTDPAPRGAVANVQVDLIGDAYADPLDFIGGLLVPALAGRSARKLFTAGITNNIPLLTHPFFLPILANELEAAAPRRADRIRRRVWSELMNGRAPNLDPTTGYAISAPAAYANDTAAMREARTSLLTLIFSGDRFRPPPNMLAADIIMYLENEKPAFAALKSYTENQFAWRTETLAGARDFITNLERSAYNKTREAAQLRHRISKAQSALYDVAFLTTMTLRAIQRRDAMTLDTTLDDAREDNSFRTLIAQDTLLVAALAEHEEDLVAVVLDWIARTKAYQNRARDLHPSEIQGIRQHEKFLRNNRAKMSDRLARALAPFLKQLNVVVGQGDPRQTYI